MNNVVYFSDRNKKKRPEFPRNILLYNGPMNIYIQIFIFIYFYKHN